MKQVVSATLNGKTIEIETGHLAKQADGSVVVRCGNNVVLVTVVSSKKESEADFFPLTVEYSERYYATGKFPGGFFKREGRPSTEATLNARLIDRPLRPCFPEGYRQETQVVATILSADGLYPVENLAAIGASAAVHISDIPFNGPIASITVSRVKGDWILNPTVTQAAEADVQIIVSGTRQGVLMIEGEANLVPEADLLKAMKYGHENLIPIIDAQDELRKRIGREKRAYVPKTIDATFRQSAETLLRDKIITALKTREKSVRYDAYSKAKQEAEAQLLANVEPSLLSQRKKELGSIVEDLKYKLSREMILKEKMRIDGRDAITVRPIANEVALLPRAHGLALFTRGETQVLGTVTLGTGEDEQIIDQMIGSYKKKFMLHYNFPPYSVGETGRMGGQSRREIGHGNLAERALKAVIPDFHDFPYTIWVVSEVLESNGSSSMGTVCSGTMALLDAGVPIKGNVAGIAMGLIKEGSDVAVLTDILGDEDHLGDMDFKVAGTREGVSAVQMDIKIDSINFDIMEKALFQARDGRLHILSKMEEVLNRPRGQLSEFAPRIETLKIRPEKVREVIGAGGKVIKGIIEETGVKIDIEDDGTIHIASSNPEMTKRAIEIINGICAEAEVGQTYKGRVVKIMDFGAFVEVLPNTQGLLHISEIAHERVRSVTDFLKEGDTIEVKVLEIDRAGRVKLSRKALLAPPAPSQN